MSEQNPDKELSLDELKDVSGGGMSLDRLGTQKGKKKKSKGSQLIPEDGILSSDDAADIVISNPSPTAPGYDIHDYERGHR
jgi:hypothetical protein